MGYRVGLHAGLHQRKVRAPTGHMHALRPDPGAGQDLTLLLHQLQARESQAAGRVHAHMT